MTKQELTTLLRSVGVSENTITAMENAYDMGVEFGQDTLRGEVNPLIDRLNMQIVALEKQLRDEA